MYACWLKYMLVLFSVTWHWHFSPVKNTKENHNKMKLFKLHLCPLTMTFLDSSILEWWDSFQAPHVVHFFLSPFAHKNKWRWPAKLFLCSDSLSKGGNKRATLINLHKKRGSLFVGFFYTLLHCCEYSCFSHIRSIFINMFLVIIT